MTQRQHCLTAAVLFVTVLGLLAFGIWDGQKSYATGPVIFPEGVTVLMDGQSIAFKVYSQCDEKRHNLVYATVTALVVLKGGC